MTFCSLSCTARSHEPSGLLTCLNSSFSPKENTGTKWALQNTKGQSENFQWKGCTYFILPSWLLQQISNNSLMSPSLPHPANFLFHMWKLTCTWNSLGRDFRNLAICGIWCYRKSRFHGASCSSVVLAMVPLFPWLEILYVFCLLCF